MKKNKSVFNLIFLFSVVSIIFLLLSSLNSNSSFMKTIITTSEFQAKTYINNVINKAINKTIDDMSISYNDFFIKSNDYDLYSISTNTILVNKFCTELNNNISEKLNEGMNENIKIPFGSLLGIEIFSNLGPNIEFKITPVGDVLVDYETDFKSSGINQTNFKIWIDIETTIKIINPLQSKEIKFNKKVMLVDTIINGRVPDRYIDFN